MPVASAISIHPVQASHRTSHGPRAAGVHGHGKKSGPDFGEVLRGHTGPGTGTGEGASEKPGVKAKQDSEQASMRSSAEAKADLEISATGPAQSRSKAAAHEDSPLAQLRAFLQGDLAAGNSKAPDASAAKEAGDSKGLSVAEKGTEAALSDAGNVNAAAGETGTTDKAGQPDRAGKEEKSGKADKDKKDQTSAAQTGAVKLPHISVQTAAPVTVASPQSSVPQRSAKRESAVPAGAPNALAPAAKSAPGKPVQQTTQAAAGQKIQGTTDGKGLPMPDGTPKPEGAQAAMGDLTGDADSAGPADVKSAGKQDAAATTSHSEVVPQAKHLNSPIPAAVHSAQIGQMAAGVAGEIAGHIPAAPQNFAGVSGPISVASSGPTVGGASPYDRIDQGAAPVVLHSSSQQMAVGVHDPSLGWVEIKTQSAAGHVDATLVASSGQTHDALAAQLPAISQFLEQRDVRVGTLMVNHQSVGSGTNHFGNGSGGGGTGARHAGPGFGGNGGNGGSSGNNGSQHHAPRSNAPVVTRPSAPTMRTGGDGSSSARPLSYISVRA